eukprot:CAMPEP_0174845254 /NCGR_PEP_ID=MMETSP1114-20130205/11617_1 /TAXON_ID=312471 /ORGANISM="Neobodo designis, Strain CCAP 1951/1" /LENGTH=821 /DNA_ID=CAMNT_0016079501 /DNA_START=142 /DNA_END=2605 /DNA_ORIENTATION=+
MAAVSRLLVLVVAFAAAAAAGARHECAHERMRDLFAKDLSREPVVEAQSAKRQRMGFRAQAPESIRVTFSTADLSDTSKHCTRAGQVVPDFAGGSVTCTADDILTSTRRSVLTNNILPAAFAKLSAALKLERLTSNIVVPQGACSHFTIPASHSSTGVANADYVLYVAAAPTSGSTLAWAGGCRTDSSGRIVIGRANFGPRYLSWDNETVQQENVATAVHELLHALGFSSASFTSSRTRDVSLRGKTATVLTLPTLASRFISYIGCGTASSIPGVELEDEGSSGSAGSHFERRVLREDIMAAAGGEKLSEMTLAVMEDLGHYTVDYSVAEPMTWGKGAGCGWVTEKCNTEAGGRDTWWCFDQSGANACTKDLRAVGTCAVLQYSTALPAYFQYFSSANIGGPKFLDGCPYVQPYSNTKCDVAREPTANEQIFGHYYGNGGRCFETTGLIQNGFSSSSSNHQRCLESRCSASGFVQMRVNGGSWETCTATGQQLSGFSGYKGAVVCPDRTTFCATHTAATAGSDARADAGTDDDHHARPWRHRAPAHTGTPADANHHGPADDDGGARADAVADADDVWGRAGDEGRAAVQRAQLAQHHRDAPHGDRLGGAHLDEPAPRPPDDDDHDHALGAGSLVIDYTINAAMRAEAIDARFQEAIQATGSTGWYAELSAVYSNNANPSDTIRPTQHTVDRTSLVCQSVNLDGETCYVVFVGAAVCVVVLVLIILWVCCCKKKKEPASDFQQRAQERRAAQEPYAQRRERSAMRTDGAATAAPPPRGMRGDRSRSRSGDKRGPKRQKPPKKDPLCRIANTIAEAAKAVVPR